MSTDKQTVQGMFRNGMSRNEISKKTGIPRTTVRRWVSGLVMGDISEKEPTITENDILRDKIRNLENSIKMSAKASLSEYYVREQIIGLCKQDPTPPIWLSNNQEYSPIAATPTVFLSDLHWGEVVDPNQIGGMNSFNLEIAHQRLRNLVDTTNKLLDRIDCDYPGIVVALGGDMLSGDIHEELSETNEAPMMPVFLDLYEKLIWTIQQFADQYGSVFVPCVTGNHSRTSRKPRAKSRNFTNFDWLLYTLLEKHFASNPNIKFYIPDGPDAIYMIHNTRYLLTHGDQFRGGDGMIGALGPIIRGDHKKRSRNGQIGQDYDCMICGHWHQLIQMQRLIVNGSLKGYDEYANTNNFGYEPPRQALWLTHPKHGIIMSMAVNVDGDISTHQASDDNWISWKK